MATEHGSKYRGRGPDKKFHCLCGETHSLLLDLQTHFEQTRTPMKTWHIEIRAFGLIRIFNVQAETRAIAEKKALASVNFKIESKEVGA